MIMLYLFITLREELPKSYIFYSPVYCLLQRIDFGKTAVKFESAMSERDTPNHKSKQHTKTKYKKEKLFGLKFDSTQLLYCVCTYTLLRPLSYPARNQGPINSCPFSPPC